MLNLFISITHRKYKSNADTKFKIDFSRKTKSVITQDGAVIIPNVNNLIGLTEIELAFKAMDGVDPKLLPKKWIKNHFKWIVWKLASYEDFTKNMNDCLNVENVIQQLKYRFAFIFMKIISKILYFLGMIEKLIERNDRLLGKYLRKMMHHKNA